MINKVCGLGALIGFVDAGSAEASAGFVAAFRKGA
jgi:hypothetical protein